MSIILCPSRGLQHDTKAIWRTRSTPSRQAIAGHDQPCHRITNKDDLVEVSFHHLANARSSRTFDQASRQSLAATWRVPSVHLPMVKSVTRSFDAHRTSNVTIGPHFLYVQAENWRFGTHRPSRGPMRSQVPLHTGSRFSANAVAPSRASFEAKTGIISDS